MVTGWYLNYIFNSLYRSMILNGILNPTEIPLNGSMVLNNT